MKKPRPALRAPFVLTLAATAMGCGASVTPSSPDAGDGAVALDVPWSGEIGVPVDRPPTGDVRNACPATLPAEGAPCSPAIDPETCTDPTRTQPGCPPGVGTTMRCNPTTQRWEQLVSTCNPPPLAQCPTDRPLEESPCPPGSYPQGTLVCQYDLCGASYSTRASCDGPAARWSVQRASCNPPAPVCPAEMPAPDATCAGPVPPECQWGNCGGLPTARGRCVDGRWSIEIAECVVDAGVVDAAIGVDI